MSLSDDAHEDVTAASLVPDDDPTPPFGFPLPPARPRRSYRKLWFSLLAATLAVVLIAAGYTVVRFMVDSSTYDDGHSAYQRADCTTAIAAYDDVINNWRLITLGGTLNRASSEKAECLVFQGAATRQQSGNAPGALASYATFIPGRPPSPLVDAARSRISDLLKQPDLATPESCDTLPILRDQKLLDATAAPPFLAACGAAYVRANNREKAQATYARLFQDHSTDKVATDTESQLTKDPSWCPWLGELRKDPILSALKDLIPGLLITCAKAPNVLPRDAILYMEDFLKQFPGHRLTPDALSTLAAMINKAARSNLDAKDFGAAHLDATIGGKSAVIMLYNDSPEKLRIAFSGPEPRVETIDPCPTCPINPPNSTANTCRKAATPKRLIITPGDYDVAIDFDESKTNGAYAHWSLQPGKQYFGCYSISSPTR